MKQASGSLITRRVLSIMGSELRKKILFIIGLPIAIYAGPIAMSQICLGNIQDQG